MDPGGPPGSLSSGGGGGGHVRRLRTLKRRKEEKREAKNKVGTEPSTRRLFSDTKYYGKIINGYVDQLNSVQVTITSQSLQQKLSFEGFNLTKLLVAGIKREKILLSPDKQYKVICASPKRYIRYRTVTNDHLWQLRCIQCPFPYAFRRMANCTLYLKNEAD